NVGLRNAVVEVLAAAGHVATPVLAVAMASLDADGRKLAIEALGRSRDPGAVDPLESALSDADRNVRRAAAEALATLGPAAEARAWSAPLGCVGDGDRVVRRAALEGLTRLGVAVPWPELAPLLEEPLTRGAALAAASFSDAPGAAPAVVRALADAAG